MSETKLPSWDSNPMVYRHTPVMLEEAVSSLNCRPGGIVVDGTLGGSGHATAICERIMPGGCFIGIDQDRDAIANGREALAPFGADVHLFHGNFSRLPEYLDRLQIDAVDGVLLDLGLSLHQLRDGGRGFSFNLDEPLDMRMDIRATKTAGDLVNTLTAPELKNIFQRFGEERWAARIARHIIEKRSDDPIRTSKQLARLVMEAIPKKAAATQKIHPATRVFMALRIAVNKELDVLAAFLETAADLLKSKGRLCILSFHSLEDRMVKQKMKQWEKPCTCPPDFPACVCNKQPLVRILSPKVRRPSPEEVAQNPMSRSTRLRAVERL